ncbi:MAG: hypothetical protein HYS38_00610 [Acidobacteria bacterium]|nr:hypothetical protein [Acidobacteriota bacterium]
MLLRSMKGFPNQVADLGKLAMAMRCIVELTEARQMARDDGILGEALVRAGVAGPGHKAKPTEEYLREQRAKTISNQSPRATARGLRELFKILGFLEDSGDTVLVTALGHRAAGFADLPVNEGQISFWRGAIRNMSHDGGDGEESHPYQVLLRLIARKPGIAKPKCALALEAKNDSQAELARIVALAGLPEEEIRNRLRISRNGDPVSQPNWKNAVKVLPKFAEQLRDVVRTGHRGEHRYQIADAPGRADVGPAEPGTEAVPARARRPSAPRAPRTSREVTPATIATAGTADTFDEVDLPLQVDPAVAAAAIRARLDRLRRHNLLVQKLATRLTATGGRLYADPFDILAVIEEIGLLAEIKTLDRTAEDERDRVRDALSQLLYYEAFVTRSVAGEVAIRKIACLEGRISDAHIRWLNTNNIAVIWQDGDGFAGDALAVRFLGRYLRELR